MREDSPVLFFDGDCGLCSRSVRFLMRRDRFKLLRFAPLQGETAARRLEESLRESLSTVVYQRTDGETLLRSDAVLQALIDIRSPLRFLARPAFFIPRSWRDAIYNWIARKRNKLFAKGSCPLPSSHNSEQILP
ncbi:MAG TPA: DUF393 domain-containing protein [Opitutales bacterium]|nr:DUF393 domain-containing protein [Opitutales bacterium]